MFRCKARWVEQGEKPTKYFFNLEKKNVDRWIVMELKDENDQILTDFKEVNKTIVDHFSKILSSKLIVANEKVQRLNFNQFVKDVEIPELTNEEQIEMENDLWRKLKKVAKLFQRNKTPATTVFPSNFMTPF